MSHKDERRGVKHQNEATARRKIRQNDREIESILKSAPHHSINA
jgi:hypothetical protein